MWGGGGVGGVLLWGRSSVCWSHPGEGRAGGGGGGGDWAGSAVTGASVKTKAE